VLCAALHKVDGEWIARTRPVYYFTVRRNTEDVETKFRYQPSRRPKEQDLSPAQVTRLVRAHLRDVGLLER
jgi:hypothetical protein